MQYMRDGLTDEFGFLRLQNKILEIMVDLDELCKNNDIDYCLMGGSALGAKRHGGFIPWDDDLDIFMTPDNYEKFRSCFNKNGDHNKYYLQELGAIDGMVTTAKIRMNNTTYVEEIVKDWDMHHGIYVDIFILHTCPSSKLQQIWQCIWAKYVIMKGLAIKGYDRRKGFLGLALRVMSIMPDYFLVKFGLKQVYKYRNKKSLYFCNFMGKAIYKNAIYKKDLFVPTEYVAFEKVLLKVPVNLHEFLTNRFGDYMEIPSLERIKWEQHAEFWDTEKDFRKYVSNIKDYSDEKRLL